MDAVVASEVTRATSPAASPFIMVFSSAHITKRCAMILPSDAIMDCAMPLAMFLNASSAFSLSMTAEANALPKPVVKLSKVCRHSSSVLYADSCIDS
ncbi:hypothetical protein M272_16840 [Vibrio natriegens NBRC 15636 = ATCC 14048 = DSM 759]|nr:hypothetical protein M272_16840 [Vibrio natriegens NBRC 15636 = ATCC 14048 = DSM 759]